MNSSETTFMDAVQPTTIFMVDDDEDFIALCTRYLKQAKHKRYSIKAGTLASHALSACTQEHFDCMVVDYRLPDGTGTEMLSALGKELGGETPPAIILTAEGCEEAAVNALRVKASDYLAKPEVTSASLSRAIDNAIEKDRLNRTLLDHNKRLQLANDELKKSADEISQFYHNISHEVKTPLTAVQEFLSLLQDETCGPVSDSQLEVIEYSLTGCKQITQLLNDLLDTTRLQTGKMRIQPVLQDVYPLVHQSVLAMAPEAHRRGICIVNDIEKKQDTLFVDALRFSQIISNLLANAIKFTNGGGKIRITGKQTASHYFIHVSDTGCGIESELLPRVFERLFQVAIGGPHSATHEGLGLGLPIAREIARLHGGDITVSSELGVGSTFCVSLPHTTPGQSSQSL